MTELLINRDWLADLAVQARNFSWLELVAVLSATGYLLLAIRQNIWCWLCAAVSTACYIVLFINARLYMEAVLNLFYLGMAVYGWYAWTSGIGDDAVLPVVRWRGHVHITAIAVVLLLAGASGALLAGHSDAVYPYLDSLTTWAAIWTTFLVARKVLENWWYWLVIDSASIIIFWSRELPLTALLFAVYVLLIPIGLINWHRDFRRQTVA